MIPRSLTLIVFQMSILGSVKFASFISARSIVIFDLAQTLMVAPVLLFGQSIAQASFPALSLQKNNRAEFGKIFTSSFNQIVYLTLPISALLIVLRIPVVRLFYGADRFDWDATVSTGLTLALFSLSITAQSLTYLLSRVFYSVNDAKTPFFITLFTTVLYVGLGFYLIRVHSLPIQYLALAFSATSILCVVLLAVFANKLLEIHKLSILVSMLKILIATFMMGLALYIPIKLLDQLVFDTTRTINLLILTGIASSLGFVAYIFFTWLLDIREAYYILRVVERFGSRNKTLKQITEVIGGMTKQNP